MDDEVREPERAKASPLSAAKAFTAARIALGRSGSSICTRDQLAFQLDHALARDAVQMEMDTRLVMDGLRARQWNALSLNSSAAEEGADPGRRLYLERPDLGRCLDADSKARLQQFASSMVGPADVAFVIADGLSALAVERHALRLLDAVQSGLAAESWRIGPVCVVRDGRVAIGDEIGSALRALLVVVLIGERPGLSAPDSLGVYLTWSPRVGRTDAERNCISNIRDGGLTYPAAAQRLVSYMNGARQMGRTGVDLKINLGLPSPAL